MKAKHLWIALGAALVALIVYRIVDYHKSETDAVESSEVVAVVTTARVSRGDLTEQVSFTGTIRPRNEVDVFAKVAGRIESLGAQVGDRVKAGQVLATLEHKEIAWQARSAQAALDVARANVAGAKLEHDRTRRLFEGGSAPQAQLDGARLRLELAEAQAAQAAAAAGLAQQQVINARVESPIAGTVTRRPVNLGAQVGPHSPLFTVQDMAALKLESSVEATSFARLAKGKPAAIEVDAFPGRSFAGQVSLLSPSLDANTRRAQIEIEVDNSEGRLLPNMFAKATVALGRLEAVVLIPKVAVFEAPGGAVVFRVKDGRAQAVRPRFGASDGQRVHVLEGLAESDEVAVTGLASLADGAKVKVAPAAAPAGQTPANVINP